MRKRWTDDQVDYLRSIAGEYALPDLVEAFNSTAHFKKWPKRTISALTNKLTELGLSRRPMVGDWIQACHAAEMLGVNTKRIARLTSDPELQAILEPRRHNFSVYVHRNNWKRLAREQPHRLRGIKVERLNELLENRKLSESIAALGPNHRNRFIVRCVETGMCYPSMAAAARAYHVTLGAISKAIKRGRPVKCLGLTFEQLQG